MANELLSALIELSHNMRKAWTTDIPSSAVVRRWLVKICVHTTCHIILLVDAFFWLESITLWLDVLVHTPCDIILFVDALLWLKSIVFKLGPWVHATCDIIPLVDALLWLETIALWQGLLSRCLLIEDLILG